MDFDLKNNLDIVQSIAPAVHSADQTGTGVDLANFHSAMAEVMTGADVGSTHAPRLEHSDVLGSGYTTVPVGDLIGSFSADIGANSVERVGYKGIKQFIRVFVATSGASLVYGANIIRGNRRKAPSA